jgi:hypothetical protein
MDLVLRGLVIAAIGFALLAANYWFVRTVVRAVFPAEFVIAPFEATPASAGGRYGLLLAEMLKARLVAVQRGLEAAHQAAERSRAAGQAEPSPDAGLTALFIPAPVEIPTGLLQPIDIRVAVGGVELTGVLAWLQSAFAARQTLRFTVVEGAERTLIVGDLGRFAAGDPHLWLESGPGADEITTNVAYALVQRKLAETGHYAIAALDAAEFRALLETLSRLDQLNERAARHHVVEGAFALLLDDIEPLLRKAPQWHELTFLAASIAEGAGNRVLAEEHYRRLLRPTGAVAPPDDRLRNWARDRLARLGVPPDIGVGEAEQRFRDTMEAFASRLGLRGPEPPIGFEPLGRGPGVLAIWSSEKRRYEIDPDQIEQPGLAQHAALQARLYARVFDRCVSEGSLDDPARLAAFNHVRFDVAAYLVESVPELPTAHLYGTRRPLFLALQRLESHGAAAVQRLAVELVERYDCDWDVASLTEQALRINREHELGLPQEAIHEAFAPLAPRPS